MNVQHEGARRRCRIGLASMFVAVGLASGCAALPPGKPGAGRSIEIPLVSGWYEDKAVQYITTDVSDAELARKMGVNFVPRLADALPPLPALPGQASAVERIYAFTNVEQGSVLASVPEPPGPANTERAYSPLWLMVMVTWLPGQTPQLLRSEEAVLAAADKGWVSVTPTRVVVNCPVVLTADGAALRGARIVER